MDTSKTGFYVVTGHYNGVSPSSTDQQETAQAGVSPHSHGRVETRVAT